MQSFGQYPIYELKQPKYEEISFNDLGKSINLSNQ